MRKCPKCGKMYSALVSVCPDCKVSLTEGGNTASSFQRTSQSSNNSANQSHQYSSQSHTSSQAQTTSQTVTNGYSKNSNGNSSYTTNSNYQGISAAPSFSKEISFGKAVKMFFKHYADFQSRSCRSEFWWCFLFQFLVSMLLGVIFPPLTSIWFLVILIPNFAINVRRLHDIGKSGWWVLIVFIPLAGLITILIFSCTPSKEPNKWGAGPNQD